MPSFENIHRNKKFAYLDGFLCGLLACHYGKKVAHKIAATRRFNRTMELFEKDTTAS